MSGIKDVFAVIMAGGRGSRLHPLTQKRSKPAVPVAGKYRLIDIPISNCINSGINRIAVLTQFNSASLHRHITNAYNQMLPSSLQILAATQTPESEDWYQGTADATRKQLDEVSNAGADLTLILAGDHIYRMDYEEMVRYHMENNADITLAVHPVGGKDASRLGILKCERSGRVLSFVEKPEPELQPRFISRDDPAAPFWGSMGIYVFTTKILVDLLTGHPEYVDFGRDVLPVVIGSLGVYSYPFEGYWEDIGTVRSYFDANLALTSPGSSFDFYAPKSPIYSNTLPLPTSIVIDSELSQVILAEGCEVRGAKISHSVIGTRSQISRGVMIKDSIILGADNIPASLGSSSIAVGIGAGSFVEGALVDENVRIGKNVVIRPFPRGVEMDGGNWFVCDGIVVIPKDAEIADGTILSPDMPFLNQKTLKGRNRPVLEIVRPKNPAMKPVPGYGSRE